MARTLSLGTGVHPSSGRPLEITCTAVGETRYANFGAYTQVTATAASGANTSLVVFAGLWANGGDTWSQVDDVAITAV